MIDRFGDLPAPTQNLVKLIEIKHQAIEANIAKIDVGARGTLVTFHKDDFPDGPGLIAYVDRLNSSNAETAKLRPDMKLVINRAWGDPESRLNGLFQLTKGQNTEAIGVKNFSPTFRALGDYDVTKLYVERESLEERGLSEGDLQEIMYEDEDDDWAEKPSVRIVSRVQLADIMANQDVVLSF